MIVKHTYSTPGTWKPSAAEQEKQLAGACELSFLKLSAGGGAAVVAVYDGTTSADVLPHKLKWFLDASTTDNDIQAFPSPLVFKEGVYAVCEQGWDFNPVVCLARIH